MSTIKGEHTNKDSSIHSTGTEKEHNSLIKIWMKIPVYLKSVLKPILFSLIVLIVIVVFSCAWRFDVANSISVFSSIISIFTAVLAFFTWSNLQKLQSDRPKQGDSTGNMSAILIVDIGPKGIKGNVQPFCEGNSNLAVITQGSGFRNVSVFNDINKAIEDTEFRVEVPKQDGRIINVTRPDIEIGRKYDNEHDRNRNDPARQCYKAFGLINSALHENGISELHVFCSCPLFIIFFLAELFSNQYKVNVYHYVPNNTDRSNGTYEYIGVMDHKFYK